MVQSGHSGTRCRFSLRRSPPCPVALPCPRPLTPGAGRRPAAGQRTAGRGGRCSPAVWHWPRHFSFCPWDCPVVLSRRRIPPLPQKTSSSPFSPPLTMTLPKPGVPPSCRIPPALSRKACKPCWNATRTPWDLWKATPTTRTMPPQIPSARWCRGSFPCCCSGTPAGATPGTGTTYWR